MYTFYTNNWDIPKWPIHKLLFIMRLTTVLLIASMLQVSASGYGQRLNYVRKQVTLLELFKEIKVQTGYNVVWPEQDVNTTTYIKANFKNTPITEVVDQSLKGLNLTYVINNKTFIIRAKTLLFLEKSKNVLQRIFQDISVRGYVVDETGEPITGVVVKVKGTMRSTRTNDKGEFNLENVDEESILIFSSLGYESLEIKATGNTGIIKLVLSTGKLQEVEINAGYYTVKQRELTGSISKITAATIENQPVNNPLMALQGRVSGLQITQSTGLPGGDFKVRIRGQNSITSGNDPLYIIDGVNYPSSGLAGNNTNFALGTTGDVSPLSLIDPSDIESIEILKDADATAIYGSRGANGVILITTRKGKQGDTKINVVFSTGFSEVGHKLDLLNTEEYLQMRMEAFKNDVLQPLTADYDLNGTWDKNKYTNWQKEVMGDKASLLNASLTLSGGTEKSNYLVAGNYYQEGSVFPADFGFKRGGIRSSINLGGRQDRFNAHFTAGYTYTRNILPGEGNNGPISFIYLPPNAPDMYNQNGQVNWGNNTLTRNPAASFMMISRAQTDNLIGNLTLNYRILTDLIFKTSIGYTTIKRQEFLKRPLSAINPDRNPLPTQRESYFGNNYNNNFIIEPQLVYEKIIGHDKLSAVVGMSLQDNDSKIGVIRASNFSSDDLMENIGSAGTIASDQNDFVHYRYIAAFGRLNYALKDRYFMNLTARRDGSSRFGYGKQFANFGAIGAGWILSDEKLVKEALPFLSFGKLRTSYGITGNDQIGNYGYLDLWNTYNIYNGNATLTPSSAAANAEFAWETNRKLEAALQLGFLKDRLNIELSYYRNRSSNQLLRENLPLSSGKQYVFRNLPAEIKNTGIELSMNVKILHGKLLQWSANVNFTKPKNKLLSYPGLETSLNATLFKVGEPLNIIKAYGVTVNEQSGLYSFEDKDGDGNLTANDRYLALSLEQTYYGGLQNSISYRRFSLDIHIAFVKQNGREFNAPLMPGRLISGSNSNQLSDVLSRWQQSGDQSFVQRFSTTSANNTLNSNKVNFSNLSVVDASYVKLKNVSLNWSLPESILSSMKISNASLTVQGQNLFTVTNYSGLDPETQGNTVMPPLRTLMLGFNVIF